MLLSATAMGLASCPVTEPLEITSTRDAVRADVAKALQGRLAVQARLAPALEEALAGERARLALKRPDLLREAALSLAGAQGPLPLPFTEMVLERRAARDRATGEFLDIFNHRFLSFLYRGRKKHHIGLNWAATESSSLAGVLEVETSRDIVTFSAFVRLVWPGAISGGSKRVER